MRYEKLPKKTPRSVRYGVYFIGLCLGTAIFIWAFITMYALIGLFSLYFYPSSGIILNVSDTVIMWLIAISSGIATTMLAFLAYYMNCLSRKAIRLSSYVFIPMLIAIVLILWQRTSLRFGYHLSWPWVWWGYEAIIAAGILPALFLHTSGARKLHDRTKIVQE